MIESVAQLKELGIPIHTLLLPVVVLGGSWIVSKTLRFHWWIVMAASCLPLFLPFLNLPFSKSYITSQPLALIGAGWILLLCIALVRAFLKPLQFQGPVSALRTVYTGLTLGALGFATLLITKPDLLESITPGTRGAFGLLLLSVSVFAASWSLFRVFRSSMVFILWAGVSLVLACEVFLSKLPHQLLREDLRSMFALVPEGVLKRAIENLEIPTLDDTSVRIGAIGSGFAGDSGRELLLQLSQYLQRGMRGKVKLSVKNFASDDMTSLRTLEVVKEQLVPWRPTLVLFSGASNDAELGGNSFGIPGLTEKEAEAEVERLKQLSRFPILRELFESRLYRYLFVGQREALAETIKSRVSPEDYQFALGEAFTALKAVGTKLVVIDETVDPVRVSETLRGYGEALRSAANGVGAEIIEFKPSDSALFLSPVRLSAQAKEEIVSRIARPLGVTDSSEQEEAIKGERSWIVRSSDLGSDIVVRVTPQFTDNRYYRVLFSINGGYIGDKRFATRDEVGVRFELPEYVRELPAVRISLSTVVSPLKDEDMIGGSQIGIPRAFDLRVNKLEGVVAEFASGVERSSGNKGFIAISFNQQSGQLEEVFRQSSPELLAAWLSTLAFGTPVLIAGQTDQSSVIQSVTGAVGGKAGGVGENFVVFGGIGFKSGDAFESWSNSELDHRFGTQSFRMHERFSVDEIKSGDKTLPI